jgi:hypothetical protein
MPAKPAKPAKSAKSAKSAGSAKSAKSAKSAGSAKSARSVKSADKPTGSGKRTTKRRKPSHDEIAKRAYFIHLEEGGRDELENWLRAERELTAD